MKAYRRIGLGRRHNLAVIYQGGLGQTSGTRGKDIQGNFTSRDIFGYRQIVGWHIRYSGTEIRCPVGRTGLNSLIGYPEVIAIRQIEFRFNSLYR